MLSASILLFTLFGTLALAFHDSGEFRACPADADTDRTGKPLHFAAGVRDRLSARQIKSENEHRRLSPLLYVAAHGAKVFFMSDDEADRKLGPRFGGGAVTYPNRDNANADDDPPFVHLSGAAAAPDVTAIPAPPQETGAKRAERYFHRTWVVSSFLLVVSCDTPVNHGSAPVASWNTIRCLLLHGDRYFLK